MKKSRREYYIKNKERIRAYQRGRVEEDRKSKAKWARVLKQDVLWHYSNGAMRCKDCGDDTFAKLCIHHENGSGSIHRESLGVRGLQFYLYLRKTGFPDDPPLGVLCKTCNMGRRRAHYRFSVRTKLSRERIRYTKELRAKGLTYAEIGKVLGRTATRAWQICLS